jgi:hypothetical protein
LSISSPAFVINSGSFSINNSNIEMASPNPQGNTDTSIFKITDNGPVSISLERTNSVNMFDNANTTATNKFVSVINYSSNNGNLIKIKSLNGLHQILVADTTDPNSTLLFAHAVNNVTNPSIELISNNDRIEHNTQNNFVAATTTPIQAVIRVDDFAGTYLSSFFFRNNLTVPTIKYLSNDDTNKYSVITNSNLSRTFLHHISVVNLDKVPPVLFSGNALSLGQKTYVIGAEAEGDNLRNGAYVSTNRLITSLDGTAYLVQPQDYALVTDSTALPGLVITLPVSRTITQRILTVLIQGPNNVVVAAQAGEQINKNGVISPTVTLTTGQFARFINSIGPGYQWSLEPINF